MTVADREVEAVITTKLLEMLPGSKVLEESVGEGLCDITAMDADYIWTDPIDGTGNFVAGSEHFC